MKILQQEETADITSSNQYQGGYRDPRIKLNCPRSQSFLLAELRLDVMVPTGITFCTSMRVGAGAHTRTHSLLRPSLSLSEAHPLDDGLLGRSRHPPHPESHHQPAFFTWKPPSSVPPPHHRPWANLSRGGKDPQQLASHFTVPAPA